MDGLKSLFVSRKFWLTAAAVAIPILNKKFGWELDSVQVAEAIAPIMALILGIAVEDHGKADPTLTPPPASSPAKP
mgnify:CR=1 FL=1